MDHPHLVILGYSEAGMFVRAAPSPPVAAILSIHGVREFGIEQQAPFRLDLTFDDVEVPAPNDVAAMSRQSARARWAKANGIVEVAPTPSDATAIIAFASAVRDAQGTVLCHCSAGMSRAPAAALICLSVWRGPGSEVECVRHVQRLRRGATPHVGLVRWADDMLDRHGKLESALRDVLR
jgi:predicted protein tyrosine phosphatase